MLDERALCASIERVVRIWKTAFFILLFVSTCFLGYVVYYTRVSQRDRARLHEIDDKIQSERRAGLDLFKFVLDARERDGLRMPRDRKAYEELQRAAGLPKKSSLDER